MPRHSLLQGRVPCGPSRRLHEGSSLAFEDLKPTPRNVQPQPFTSLCGHGP